MKFFASMALCLALVACGGDDANAAVTTDSGATDSGESAEWIHNDFDRAMELSAETGKPVFIDMYADWCRPCVMLSDEYFSRDDYKQVLSKCILLKIDVDDNQDLARRYRVQSIPTMLLTDSNGNEIDRITGVMGSPENFLPMFSAFVMQAL